MADFFDTDPNSGVLDINVAGLNNNSMNNNGCLSPGDDDEEILEATLPGSTAGAMQQDEPQEEAGTNEATMTVCDPDHMEERFRVDRKKLEQMLQGKLCRQSNVHKDMKDVMLYKLVNSTYQNRS